MPREIERENKFSRYMQKRVRPPNVYFVIDATQSMDFVSNKLMTFVGSIVYFIKFRFRYYNFNFGAVIYRDPIDYKTPQSEEFQESQTHTKEHQEEEKQPTNDRISFLFDKNVPIEFSTDFNRFYATIRKVKIGSGNNEIDDWVGALQCALDELQWGQESKKVIVWISNSNAHGKKFCGIDNHNEEEIKLIHLVERAAEEGFNFIAVNLHQENKEGCKKTLIEMKNIFENSINDKRYGFIINEVCDNDLDESFERSVAYQFQQFLG